MDPVKHCDVYCEEGCSHVDGFLCNMEDCDILEKFRVEKNFESLKEAPENKKLEKRV